MESIFQASDQHKQQAQLALNLLLFLYFFAGLASL
jgi:hypothetical protein